MKNYVEFSSILERTFEDALLCSKYWDRFAAYATCAKAHEEIENCTWLSNQINHYSNGS